MAIVELDVAIGERTPKEDVNFSLAHMKLDPNRHLHVRDNP